MGVATYIKDEKDAIKEVILQSGIKVKPVYTPDDLERIGFDYKEDLGIQGNSPLRGVSIPKGSGVGTGRPASIPGLALPRRPMNDSS